MIDLNFIFRGLFLGPSVMMLGFFMDRFFCKKELYSLMNKHDKLLEQAEKKITINLTVISSLLYWFVTPLYVNYDKDNIDIQWFRGILLIFIQNIGYYYGHYIMHQYLYSIHSFHHLFDDNVTSSIAFAVSMEEFLFAYILPLIFGSFLLHPNENTFLLVIGLIAVFNLIIHTPCLQTKYYPALFVSPNDHLEHHKKRTIHYAAPIFSIDRILLFFKK
jgi:sterol desaturase/sphingolipid hydroxylase (fatty acid hydroxylase superfamily)